jgi:ribosomal protein S7
MIKGKRQKVEKMIYTVFSIIKHTYQIHGLIFLYECVYLLLPAFLLVPIKRGPTTIFLPTVMRRSKKHGIALHEFIKSIKISKKMNSNQKIETLVLEALLYLVIERQSTALDKKNHDLRVAFSNRKFVHYRW